MIAYMLGYMKEPNQFLARSMQVSPTILSIHLHQWWRILSYRLERRVCRECRPLDMWVASIIKGICMHDEDIIDRLGVCCVLCVFICIAMLPPH